MERRWLPAMAVAIVLSTGIGYAVGDSKIPDQVEVLVPSPYAVPSPYEVLVPSPYPFAAEACLDALDLYAEWVVSDAQFFVDLYDAYLDYPDETLTDFGRRVESLLLTLDGPRQTDLDRMADYEADCRAAE